ncbi:glycosyl transferase [Paracoccus sediminis]|uniref:Peptide O-xylosyltransferase n=1 Tax=Paracoccus sediminis TaxID=1214787 RepID=A0A238VND4_9RHOB|nr:DUF5928 domain-containing protein [Paracoccus sediminis]TBN52286.1 glycosyl transferase [Paracoccus sediminis]SNR35253.1 Core-2/I-Branching enzyme [Paracoccus sediminis]
MARIAFILLAHKDPQGVVDQARRLTATGDHVVIHYDRNAPAADYRRIRDCLADNGGVVLAPRRFRCGWGDWSLVAATLSALQTAERRFPQATHFYLLSGDCMPIKSAEYARAFLDRDDCDYIESFDFFDSDWIKTGIRTERLVYRHWFNERRHRRLFYAALRAQQWLRLRRKPPQGVQVMIGSQWWCLRRGTVEAVLALIRERRDLTRFFRTTWIPDETFFQTLVAHLVPKGEIRRRSPTCLMFTDYGMPVTFYNDHYDLLIRQDYLFARKISAEAQDLRARLGVLWQAEGIGFAISNEAPRLFRFLTGRGRVGGRFAPRFWEDHGATRGSTICLIVAKKWHVAKRLTARIRALTDIPAMDYVFNERDAGLPDLGGIASTLAKRERHRRALVRLLLDDCGSRQLVLCLDPSALPLIADFAADRSRTRILFIDSHFDEAYLRGHMRRIGLAGEGTPETVIRDLLPVVARDLAHEADRLHRMGLAGFSSIADSAPADANAAALAGFLDVSHKVAHDLAQTPHLFTD